MLVALNRQHVGYQRVVAREVIGIAVAQPLDRLLGVDIALHRRVGQREHGLTQRVASVLSANT